MPAKKTENKGLRTWIEIDKTAAENNYKIFRKLIAKKCSLMAVVKSNAYGHGLVDFSLLVQKLGADWFGVDSVIEGLALRKAGVRKNILVLGYTLLEKLDEAAKNNISLTISSLNQLESVRRMRLNRSLKIHLKIDTGMHRQGFLIDELPLALELIKKSPKNMAVEGVYTHFAAVKSPDAPFDTLRQIKIFDEAVKILKSAGLNPIKHSAATAGTIIFPQAHYDMVRIGIGLYGLWPSKEIKSAFENKINLKPVLSWKTIVGEIKNLDSGERIGYDLTELLSRPAKVAILPIGYWHGFSRSLSSIGRVLIAGKSAKVLGRVSMDMIAVDASATQNVKPGDEAVIIGGSGKAILSADDMAENINTNNYEVVTRLNPLMKRIYI